MFRVHIPCYDYGRIWYVALILGFMRPWKDGGDL